MTRFPFKFKRPAPSDDLKVVFHIGMPKCASTTIQAHFADHDRHYAEHGLLYPKSHRLEDGYRHHEPLFDPSLTEADAADHILQEARDNQCSNILLSCERFSTDTSGQLARLTDAFSERLGEDAVEILFVVRDPISLLRSSYAQFIKAGLWGINKTVFFSQTDGTLNTYIEAFKTRWGYNWYDYEGILDHAVQSARYGRLSLCDLSQEKNILGALTRKFNVEPAPVTEQKNQRLSRNRIKFLHDFQTTYGVGAYLDNKRLLVNQVDLSKIPYSRDDSLRDGLDITDAALLERFPDLDQPRQALAARLPSI